MKKRVNYLLQKYTVGQLNQAEEEELLILTNTQAELVANEIAEMLTQAEVSLKMPAFYNASQVLDKILAVDKPFVRKEAKMLSLLRWTAAAALFIISSVSIYFYVTNNEWGTKETAKSAIVPGGNKAILMLADGRKISLTDVGNGDVAKQAGLSIKKTSDGQLIYTVTETKYKAGAENTFNTIETPRGGTWQVKLPDGTLVWLNAASSLKYPLTFSSAKQRLVELKGEAYFEVSKNKDLPFVVRTANQEIKVLGTHFNVDSYADELVTKTTLLEGSVMITPNNVSDSYRLKPGEQAVLSAGQLKVNAMDVEESIAWKEGYFMFNIEKLSSIMRKISRWYDVEVEYTDPKIMDLTFYGTVGRFEKVSQILRMFEQNGKVKFKIINNKIIVDREG